MLTLAHVRALRDNPSSTVRAEIAGAVAADLAAAQLTEPERQIAEQILETLAHDFDHRVRQALVEHVKECPFLPRQVALTLAADIEDCVALPIIEFSPVLSDADLILHVRAGSATRQLAVARRKVVAAEIADALMETGEPEIVGAVLANFGAAVSEGALLKVAVRFRGENSIEALLVGRPILPLTVCDILIRRVSRQLRELLVAKHQIPAFLADELVVNGQEKALAEIIPFGDAEAAERLARRLHTRHRLTPTLVLRTLCAGDLGFFDSAMATLAMIPVSNARTLLYDRGADGLRAIYHKAGLPPELFRAFRVAVSAVLDGHLKSGPVAYARRITDQLLLAYADVSPAGLEGVLAQLSSHAAGHGATPSGLLAAQH